MKKLLLALMFGLNLSCEPPSPDQAIASARPRQATASARPRQATASTRPRQATASARPRQATASTRPRQATASARPRQSIDFEQARRQMVEEQIEARGVTDSRVLEAMSRVPRHEYVPARYRAFAYSDTPLRIGFEQTISQPYIVALMTELVQSEPDDRVLEIGTGSGYQAAVAAELVSEVYSIEIIPELARSASDRLERLGVSNVVVRAGDGYLGWPEQSPFDGILVTAGAEHIPQPLVEQLRPGARMVIPVGDSSSVQTLRVVEKLPGGEVEIRDIIPVRFVPLRRN